MQVPDLDEQEWQSIAAGEFLTKLASTDDEIRLFRYRIIGDVLLSYSEMARDNGLWPIRPAVHLEECVFKGKAWFHAARFERAVTFHAARFESDAHFSGAVFCESVTFDDVRFGPRPKFMQTRFEKDADFTYSVFEGQTVFSKAEFEGNVYFPQASFQSNALFGMARFRYPASFDNVRYWPDTVGYAVLRRVFTGNGRDRIFWRRRNSDNDDDSARSLTRRVLPTDRYPATPPAKSTIFYLDPSNIDEAVNPAFRRYVADQVYVRAFKTEHPKVASLWRVSADYGRSGLLWSLWSVAIAFAFAGVYRVLLNDAFTLTYAKTSDIGFWDYLYYSVVTFTTLGFGDIVPTRLAARLVVMAEVIAGYVMLGGLISIFANKLARRS